MRYNVVDSLNEIAEVLRNKTVDDGEATLRYGTIERHLKSIADSMEELCDLASTMIYLHAVQITSADLDQIHKVYRIRDYYVTKAMGRRI